MASILSMQKQKFKIFMRRLLLGLALLVISVGGNAQSNSLGINAGFGHAWLKNYNDAEFMPHGNFGLSYVHSTKTRFGFGADAKYSIEGGKREYMSGNVPLEQTTKL